MQPTTVNGTVVRILLCATNTVHDVELKKFWLAGAGRLCMDILSELTLTPKTYLLKNIVIYA